MAAPLDPRHLDHAIELYLAGEPQSEILTTTGISATSLHRERGRRGIPPRRNLLLDVQALADAYLSGESEYAISKRLGISRATIRERLRQADVAVRNSSQAGLLRASKMPATQRAQQVAAAHQAKRGKPATLADLETRARTRERDGKFGSEGERFLAYLLEERGLRPIPQKAVGKYNVDFAVGPVAVEVLGGNWHATKRTHATRTPHILNAGWNLVFVWNAKTYSPITSGAADHIVAVCEEMDWQPPAVCQYRVISGSGQLLAAGSANSGAFTLVPPPRGTKRPRS